MTRTRGGTGGWLPAVVLGWALVVVLGSAAWGQVDGPPAEGGPAHSQVPESPPPALEGQPQVPPAPPDTTSAKEVPVKADAGVCDGLPLPARLSCNAGTAVLGAVRNPVGTAGDAAEAVVGAAFDKAAGLSVQALTDWVVGGAGWLMNELSGIIDRTTSPKLEAEWFASHYRTMVALAAVMVLPLLLLSILGAVVTQDLSRLLRTVFGFLPLAGIFAGAAVALVSVALTVTDGMTSWVSQGAGADASAFLSNAAGALGTIRGTASNGSLFAVFLGAVVMAVGAVVVWLELLVRQAAVYIAVLFLPVAIAGVVWPATAHWCKRLVHILVAVVLSKFVIAAILSLAASGLAASGDQGGFGAVLSGGALLTLAALAPLALLRLVPVLEAGVLTTATLKGERSSATSAALGGPQWLYGQARGWAARDAATPPPPTWAGRTGAAGGSASVGGATALAVAAGQAHSQAQPTNNSAAPVGVGTGGGGSHRRNPSRHAPAVGIPEVPRSTDPSRGDRSGDDRGH
jgi:hypothetical protein